MIEVIVKKEHYPSWTSLRMIRVFHFKIIAKIYKYFKEKKGYEVEICK